uniref:Uncharacterized protein n=1 Tax=Anguilla anguilla TaxID=7936 RepID=A0A0E9VH67_ANGAN
MTFPLKRELTACLPTPL